MDPRYVLRLEDELVDIVDRIYNPEVPAERVGALVGTSREILDCLYTRHHDGYVRQRYLQRVAQLPHVWVAPFVVLLIGEYVVEIIRDVEDGLKDLNVEGSAQRLQYGAFAARNPAFIDLTAQRAASRGCRGSALIESLRAAGAACERRW